MPFDKIIRPSVGPDLSRPPPIYRPGWLFRSPDYFVHLHYRVPTHNSVQIMKNAPPSDSAPRSNFQS